LICPDRDVCHTYMKAVIDETSHVTHESCHTTTGGLSYGVATLSRIDKRIGLFGKRDLLKRQYSAKETYNLIDPTDHSHA